MARGFKFLIKEIEELHYLLSKNKGPGQLRGYHPDLGLCFCINAKSRFSHDAARGFSMKCYFLLSGSQ